MGTLLEASTTLKCQCSHNLLRALRGGLKPDTMSLNSARSMDAFLVAPKYMGGGKQLIALVRSNGCNFANRQKVHVACEPSFLTSTHAAIMLVGVLLATCRQDPSRKLNKNDWRTFTVSSDDCSSSEGCSLCTTIPRSCASRPSCFTLKFTTVVFVDT